MRPSPKISSGRPWYASMLFLSLVRKEEARANVKAREERGGEPQSSKFCNKPMTHMSVTSIESPEKALLPGINDMREYWYVQSLSTG